MNCASCDFWMFHGDKARVIVTADRGECRRHSPIRIKRGDNEDFREWPVTYADDWCGDYQRHPTRRLRESA